MCFFFFPDHTSGLADGTRLEGRTIRVAMRNWIFHLRSMASWLCAGFTSPGAATVDAVSSAPDGVYLMNTLTSHQLFYSVTLLCFSSVELFYVVKLFQWNFEKEMNRQMRPELAISSEEEVLLCWQGIVMAVFFIHIWFQVLMVLFMPSQGFKRRWVYMETLTWCCICSLKWTFYLVQACPSFIVHFGNWKCPSMMEAMGKMFSSVLTDFTAEKATAGCVWFDCLLSELPFLS